MFATLLTLALVAAPALRSVAAFSMSTPDLTQCGSAHVTWDETEGPYNLVVVNSSAPCGDILADLGDHSGTSITWKVDFPAGSTLMFSLEDKNGDEAWSAPMTVAESSDVSCLDNAAAASSSAAAGSVGSSSADSYLPTETVQAAGAAVTDGSSTDDGSGTIIGGASEGTSAGFVVRVNPVMALCAVFAVALTL